MNVVLVTAALFLAGASGAMAQSFSCPYGEQPACLDYGDKVCSSAGKCVDQSAACFDSWQCDYQGFTCKSNVTDLAKKYEALADDYNELVSKSRTLASDYDRLLAESRSLADEYDDLESRYDDLESSIDDMKSCIRNAYDLDDAQSCSL